MNTQFSQAVIATVAACIGKGLAVDILRDYALQGSEVFEEHVQSCTALIAHNEGAKEGTGLATLQKHKAKGAGTLMSYAIGFRKLLKVGDTEAIANATARELAGVKKAAPKPSQAAELKAVEAPTPVDTPAPVESLAPVALIDRMEALHTAHGLTPDDYARMASMCAVYESRKVIQEAQALA